MRRIIPPLIAAAALLLAINWLPESLHHAFGEYASSILKPIFGPILNLLSKPSFVFIASGVIFIFGVAICIIHVKYFVMGDLARLSSLGGQVRQLAVPGDVGAPTPDEALEILGRMLRNASIFNSTYEEYLAEREVKGRLPSASFEKSIHPSEWARERPLKALFEASPGYFTTVGLILTFAGLVAALYFAARGFRTGSAEEAQMAIIQLLNASSFKFLTSVAALIAAFCISLTIKIGEASLRIRAIETAISIDKYMRAWTAKAPLKKEDTDISNLIVEIRSLISAIQQSKKFNSSINNE